MSPESRGAFASPQLDLFLHFFADTRERRLTFSTCLESNTDYYFHYQAPGEGSLGGGRIDVPWLWIFSVPSAFYGVFFIGKYFD
jgi:hypothetical protein